MAEELAAEVVLRTIIGRGRGEELLWVQVLEVVLVREGMGVLAELVEVEAGMEEQHLQMGATRTLEVGEEDLASYTLV